MKDNKLEIGDVLYYYIRVGSPYIKKIIINRVTKCYAYAQTFNFGQKFEMKLCITLSPKGEVQQSLSSQAVYLENEKLKAKYHLQILQSEIKNSFVVIRNSFSENAINEMTLPQLEELKKWLEVQPIKEKYL